MIDADKIMNSQYFGSDPADIRIQINPDKFRLSLDVMVEVCALWFMLSEHSLVFKIHSFFVISTKRHWKTF